MGLQKYCVHQFLSSRAKTRSTQSKTYLKYRGVITFIKRNTDVSTSDVKYFMKFVWNRFVFHNITFNSFKNNGFCLQSHSRLESYGRHSSFGTKISGSQLFSAMSFVSTQYSFCNSFRHGLVLLVYIYVISWPILFTMSIL